MWTYDMYTKTKNELDLYSSTGIDDQKFNVEKKKKSRLQKLQRMMIFV